MKSFKEIYKYIAYEELGGITFQNGNKYVTIDSAMNEDFTAIYIAEGIDDIDNRKIMIRLHRSDLIHDTIMRMSEYFGCNKSQVYDEIRILKDIVYLLYGI